MHRTSLLAVVALALAILVLPLPTASASVPATCDERASGCWRAPYTWVVGGPEEGVGVTEYGALQVAAAGWYVNVDSLPSVIQQGRS